MIDCIILLLTILLREEEEDDDKINDDVTTLLQNIMEYNNIVETIIGSEINFIFLV